MKPVGLIAPYQEMAEIAREICKEFEKPIVVEVGDLQEGLKKGQLLVEDGGSHHRRHGGPACP